MTIKCGASRTGGAGASAARKMPAIQSGLLS